MNAKGADDVAALVAEYADLRVAQDAAFDTPRKANRLFDRAHVIAKRLRTTEEGRAALMSLMLHDDRGVRLGAAAECTPFAPDQSRVILRELIDPRGRHSLDAEMTLKELDAGRLKMDW
jgi:hypothetical protein